MKRMFLAFLCLALLAGCSQNEGACFVSLRLSVEKSIESSRMDAVAYHRYTAYRSSVFPTDEGVVEDAELLVKDGVASIGRITQGRWTFTVRAYSERDALLYEGSATVYVGASDVSVPIVLSQRKGESGFVDVDVTALKTTQKAPSLVAIWESYDGEVKGSNALWDVSDEGTYWRFSGRLTIEASRCLLTMSVFSETKDASSCTDLMVVGGDTTHVTGFLNPGSDVQGFIRVEGPNVVRGALECTTAMEPGKACTFKWTNLGCQVTHYVWAVDGEVQSSTGPVMTFVPPTWGNYTIVCIASNDDGETGRAVYGIGSDGTSWTILGRGILKDLGEDYGTYAFSEDGTMCMRLSGRGGRYLAFGGCIEGAGIEGNPSIMWAPYVDGLELTEALGTSSTSGAGNTLLLVGRDSSLTSHQSGGRRWISLGAAFSRLEGKGLYIPSYDEMLLVVQGVNEGRLDVPDGSWWTSTDSGETAWAMVVSEGSATMTRLSKTAEAGLLYVRVV